MFLFRFPAFLICLCNCCLLISVVVFELLVLFHFPSPSLRFFRPCIYLSSYIRLLYLYLCIFIANGTRTQSLSGCLGRVLALFLSCAPSRIQVANSNLARVSSDSCSPSTLMLHFCSPSTVKFFDHII